MTNDHAATACSSFGPFFHSDSEILLFLYLLDGASIHAVLLPDIVSSIMHDFALLDVEAHLPFLCPLAYFVEVCLHLLRIAVIPNCHGELCVF